MKRGILFKRIKAQKPKDLSEFIGKELKMMDGQTVKVETIVGSMVKPTRYEVNHAHHIVILDAYKQLNNDKSITQEMIDAFDEMIVEDIQKEPTKRSLIDATETHVKPC